MTLVKFLQDFQGIETRGAFYKQGDVVDIDDGLVNRLVVDKRVELVQKPVVPQPVPVHYGAQPEPELRHDEDLYPKDEDVFGKLSDATEEQEIMTSKPRAKRGRK
jgi:hypothetical protein